MSRSGERLRKRKSKSYEEYDDKGWGEDASSEDDDRKKRGRKKKMDKNEESDQNEEGEEEEELSEELFEQQVEHVGLSANSLTFLEEFLFIRPYSSFCSPFLNQSIGTTQKISNSLSNSLGNENLPENQKISLVQSLEQVNPSSPTQPSEQISLQNYNSSSQNKIPITNEKVEETVFLEIRNLIVTKWLQNASSFLYYNQITKIKKQYIRLSKRIYLYLNFFGYINMGILKNCPQDVKQYFEQIRNLPDVLSTPKRQNSISSQITNSPLKTNSPIILSTSSSISSSLIKKEEGTDSVFSSQQDNEEPSQEVELKNESSTTPPSSPPIPVISPIISSETMSPDPSSPPTTNIPFLSTPPDTPVVLETPTKDQTIDANSSQITSTPPSPSLPQHIETEKKIMIIGGGMAGLGVAHHLKKLGFKNIIILEGRSRVGGRCLTDTSLGAPIDIGAMVVTGHLGNPIITVCSQVEEQLHPLGEKCVIFGFDGNQIPEHIDQNMELAFNEALEHSKTTGPNDLGTSLRKFLSDHQEQYSSEINLKNEESGGNSMELESLSVKGKKLTKQERVKLEESVINWHWANLEYGCAAELEQVSVHHWDQDDQYEFHGKHYLLRRGYSSVVNSLKDFFFDKYVSSEKSNNLLENQNIHNGNGSISNQNEVSNLSSLPKTSKRRGRATKVQKKQEKQRQQMDTPSPQKLENLNQSHTQDDLDQSIGQEDLDRNHKIIYNCTVSKIQYPSLIELQNYFSDPILSQSYSFPSSLSLSSSASASTSASPPSNSSITLSSSTSSLPISTLPSLPQVKITTTSGEEYSADIVVVTVPIAVLQSQSFQFEPELPLWKKMAMNNLGSGLLNKVCLSFSHVFWDSVANDDYFGYTNEKGKDRGEYFLFWNMQRCVGKPILLALVAGASAHKHESLSDDEITERTLDVLRKIFGEIAEVTGRVVTRWKQDPHAQCSYSYITISGTGDDYDRMAQPVSPQLFFAGEATNRQHPATVAGAFQSGLKVGGCIATLLTHPDFFTNYPLLTELCHSCFSSSSLERGFTSKKKTRKIRDSKSNTGLNRKKGRASIKQIKPTLINNENKESTELVSRLPKFFKRSLSSSSESLISNTEVKNEEVSLTGSEKKSPIKSISQNSIISNNSINSFSPNNNIINNNSMSIAQSQSLKNKRAPTNKFLPQNEKGLLSTPPPPPPISSPNPRFSNQLPPRMNMRTPPFPSSQPFFGDVGSPFFMDSPLIPSTPPSKYYPPNYYVPNSNPPPHPFPFTIPHPQAHFYPPSHIQGVPLHPLPPSTSPSLPPPPPPPPPTVSPVMSEHYISNDITEDLSSKSSNNNDVNMFEIKLKLPEFREKVSEVVVEKLKKFLQAKRIATKEDFKHLARKLTHLVIQKENSGADKDYYIFSYEVKRKVKKFVVSYFQHLPNGVYSRSDS